VAGRIFPVLSVAAVDAMLVSTAEFNLLTCPQVYNSILFLFRAHSQAI
jgi:hypothetical protein